MQRHIPENESSAERKKREEKEEEERERDDKFDKASAKLGKSRLQVGKILSVTQITQSFAFNIFFTDVSYKLDDLEVKEQNRNLKKKLNKFCTVVSKISSFVVKKWQCSI